MQRDYEIVVWIYASGFRNANYLKNLFKKRFGMSMRKYRATNQTTFTVTDPAHARSGKGGRAPRKRRRARVVIGNLPAKPNASTAGTVPARKIKFVPTDS